MNSTLMRVPRMAGFPPRTAGSATIHSAVIWASVPDKFEHVDTAVLRTNVRRLALPMTAARSLLQGL
jgi:hypothetical protein